MKRCLVSALVLLALSQPVLAAEPSAASPADVTSQGARVLAPLPVWPRGVPPVAGTADHWIEEFLWWIEAEGLTRPKG